MAEALGMLGLPAAVLRPGGGLLVANKQFEELIPRTFHDRRDRLVATDRSGDALLAKALAWQGNRRRPVASIPIGASDDRPPLIAHVVPVCGSAHDIFPNSTSILLITELVHREGPSADLLQGLFDLTPAEARVAKGIGEGQSINLVALALGLSRETVRSRLKDILAKTGLHRQAELAGLLAAVPAPRTQV